ncbi:two-component regulator propeller domain-containing protein [Ascidiimonas sp. W6]|uniref:hybrid sensor histidine kinase/response regulator transcription factor n=1 Tax=Ascidiimonas meishanensis TaxID=3128903 RepID=UPI0030ECCC16
MNKEVLLICLLLATIFNLQAQSFYTDYRKLSTENGLSHNYVTSLIQSRDGIIWVGTINGLNKFDGYNFTVYKSNPKDSTSISNNSITALGQESNGLIWISTDGGGISRFDPNTDKFKQYVQKPNDSSKITHNHYYTLFVDSKDRVWAGNWDGLDLYNPELDIFERILSSEEFDYAYGIYSIVEDKKNRLWLGTDSNGLQRYNPETKKVEAVFKYDYKNSSSISADFVNYIFIDSKENIWILHGNDTASKIDRVNPNNGLVDTFDFSSQGYKDLCTGLFEDKNNNIWVLFETSGIKQLNTSTGLLESLDKKLPIIQERITEVFKDRDGSLWLGTEEGITYFSSKLKSFEFWPNMPVYPSDTKKPVDGILESKNGDIWFVNESYGIRKLNPKTNKIETFPKLHEFLEKKGSKIEVSDVMEDSLGNIWFTYSYGFIKINPLNSEFKNYNYLKSVNEYEYFKTTQYNRIIQSKNGKIWVGTYDGWLLEFNPITELFENAYLYGLEDDSLNIAKLPGYYLTELYQDDSDNIYVGFLDEGLYQLHNETKEFSKIIYQDTANIDTNAKYVTYAYRSKNILWIGTGNGLFNKNLKTGEFSSFNIQEGLADNFISAITEDNVGNLWVSTSKGISKLDPKTNKFTNYDSKEGLQQADFRIGSCFKNSEKGLLYFGGDKGFNVFDPNNIKDNNIVPSIVITNFKNQNSEGNFINIPGINFKNKIKLPYDERDFTVEVAALDFTNPDKNQYAYWLEGYNKNWIKIGDNREVTFNNLSPGTYTLRLKGSNNDGIWNKAGKSIDITIIPPWWRTWWAYSLYLFLFLFLLYGIYSYRINQLENIRLLELDEAKRTMYTNITHEFRTPLTVISGINQELREQTGGAYKQHFDLIDRNSKNMLDLVNQLLELRKLEIGKNQVNFIQNDIIAYLKYISETFVSYAKTNNINLYFVCITNELIMDYDPDKLLMILSNLLSNAIKYSKSGSEIYLQVDEFKDALQIRVVDSGKGIPEKELPLIFERFYKVKNNHKDNIDGIGVGLALTKELVHLLKGEITVNSHLDKGTIFTVTLPIQKNASLEKKMAQAPRFVEIFNNIKTDNFAKNHQNKSANDALKLLVIEDNKDIITYLTKCVEKQWNLTIRQDGQKGIDEAIENVPDIILCDLMMPNADGYQVLDTLKNDTKTSHIPIVILTAKADDESRIKAYKKGADVFLLKPFNKEELLTILEKLVQQRRQLQERHTSQIATFFKESSEIHKEDTFIKKLEELVLAENSKNSYNVTRLCNDLGMSRTQLHNKIKALTGKSTSIFVRSLRLSKGKYLLEHTNKGISEIAYEVGFNNPSYFTKSFTEEFGLPPSTLRKE